MLGYQDWKMRIKLMLLLSPLLLVIISYCAVRTLPSILLDRLIHLLYTLINRCIQIDFTVNPYCSP